MSVLQHTLLLHQRLYQCLISSILYDVMICSCFVHMVAPPTRQLNTHRHAKYAEAQVAVYDLMRGVGYAPTVLPAVSAKSQLCAC